MVLAEKGRSLQSIEITGFMLWTPWKKDFLSFPKESAKSSK
ncbi:hypothetical protein [Robinsoniella peoriensis]